MRNLNKDLGPFILSGKEVSIVDIAMYSYVNSMLELAEKSEGIDENVQRWIDIIEGRDGIK